MIKQLKAMAVKPALYEKGTMELWTDEHISKGMLEAHLNPDWDAATRNYSAVQKTVKWISSAAPPGKYQNLLDLGCGPGIYAEEFHKAGYTVSGLDFSERSIHYAQKSTREKNLPITYRCQSYLTLDAAARFDLITLIYYDFGVLSTEDRARLLKNIYAALKPGGLLIFDALTPHHYAGRHNEYTRWEYADKSFFCAEPHLRLESFFVYESQHTFCEQHILLTDNAARSINIWEHVFTKNELEQDLKSAGFSSHKFYGSIDGAEYSGDRKEIGIVTQK